jgi:hypothetical protein
MLKIKDNVDLKELEKFSFELSTNNEDLKDQEWKVETGFWDKEEIVYVYEQLVVNVETREINIETIYNNLNGDEEIIKLFDLIKADLVEKVEESDVKN